MNLIWLLILGALWGSSYLFIKVIVAEVPPMTLVAARLTLGAAVMWLLLLVTRQPIPRRRSEWGAFAVMGILNGALPYSLISWSEQHIPSGLAALLQGTMPIFTVLLAQVVSRDEKMTAAKVAGILLGFVGIGVLMAPELRDGVGGIAAGGAGVLGQLGMIASSVSYAGAGLFARSRLKGQPALVSTAGQITMGAAYMLPLSLLIDRPFHLAPSAPAIWSWLGLTIVGTVVAYVIYYYLISRTSATFVSTVTYIIPVFGLILGAVVLGEPLSLTLFVSLALILGGVLLVRRA